MSASSRGPAVRFWRSLRRIAALLLAMMLTLLVGAFVVDPANQKKIRIGGYTLKVPEGAGFERMDTGEYRLLLDQKHGNFTSNRELARVASRGLLGERSTTGMLRHVVGTVWFPADTRVCLADEPEGHRGAETWVVQYYRQAYFDVQGLAYRYRHGVLVIRNRTVGGGMVIDVSRMDEPGDRVVVDWEPVRAHLRTLLRNSDPSPDRPSGAWAGGTRRLKAWWAALLRRPREPETTESPLDVPPPPSTPVCVGPYQLKRGELGQQPVPRGAPWDRHGGYTLSLPGGPTARVTYRAKPSRGKQPVGFAVLSPAGEAKWLPEKDCVRGLDAPVTFHNKRGAKQNYKRLSKGRHYVGIMAVVAMTTPGNLVFDVSYPWPVDQEVNWEPLERYLDDLRLAIIVGDFTAPDQGGERDRGLQLGSCPA
jgi:hypothetical protein